MNAGTKVVNSKQKVWDPVIPTKLTFIQLKLIIVNMKIAILRVRVKKVINTIKLMYIQPKHSNARSLGAISPPKIKWLSIITGKIFMSSVSPSAKSLDAILNQRTKEVFRITLEINME